MSDIDLWGVMVAINNNEPDLEALYQQFQYLSPEHKAKLLKRVFSEGAMQVNVNSPITIQLNTPDKESLSRLLDTIAELLIRQK